MARKPRVHYPTAVYHVMLRGNAGQTIFADEADRTRFLLLLQEGIERFSSRIHAFCLMTNHIHLVVQVGAIPLSRFMQNVSFRYTRYFNAKKGVTGHLFQGRFKAILIDADNYLVELVRYLHLNPVRSGMVNLPEQYPWSSHLTYCGKERSPWLTTQWVLTQFSDQVDESIRRFETFVADGLGEEYRKEFHQGTQDGQLLGDDRFAEDLMRKVRGEYQRPVSLDEIIEYVSKLYALDPNELALPGKQRIRSEARAVIGMLVQELEHLSLTELARRTQRELSSVSYGTNRLVSRAKSDKDLAARLKEIKEGLFAGGKPSSSGAISISQA
jgi:REP element-mobilizing transposase RayT